VGYENCYNLVVGLSSHCIQVDISSKYGCAIIDYVGSAWVMLYDNVYVVCRFQSRDWCWLRWWQKVVVKVQILYVQKIYQTTTFGVVVVFCLSQAQDWSRCMAAQRHAQWLFDLWLGARRTNFVCPDVYELWKIQSLVKWVIIPCLDPLIWPCSFTHMTFN